MIGSLVARIRMGPPTPASTESWEIVADLPGGIAQVVAIRNTLSEAKAFVDGWNLASSSPNESRSKGGDIAPIGVGEHGFTFSKNVPVMTRKGRLSTPRDWIFEVGHWLEGRGWKKLGRRLMWWSA